MTSRGSFPGKRHLLVAGVLGAFAASIPAMANSETTPVEAVNEGGVYGETHRWSNASQTVLAGDTVTFRNSTEVPHGVEWRSSLKPACSSGVPVGSTPAASGTKWSGTCTFSQAGTYTFWCTVHGPEMSGTITVDPSGTTTVEMTPPPAVPPAPAPAPPAATPPSAPAAESPLAGPPSKAVKLAHSQRGGSVRGVIEVSKAGAGGRLEVQLIAQRASLARGGRSARVIVGGLTRRSLSAGRLFFAVKLNVRGLRALSRHHRLALTVKIALAGPTGKPVTVVRGVVQHG